MPAAGSVSACAEDQAAKMRWKPLIELIRSITTLLVEIIMGIRIPRSDDQAKTKMYTETWAAL